MQQNQNDHLTSAVPSQASKTALFPALYTVHTPSGPVHACTHHASDIAAVMLCMGAHAALTPAPDGAECANCKNKA